MLGGLLILDSADHFYTCDGSGRLVARSDRAEHMEKYQGTYTFECDMWKLSAYCTKLICEVVDSDAEAICKLHSRTLKNSNGAGCNVDCSAASGILGTSMAAVAILAVVAVAATG